MVGTSKDDTFIINSFDDVENIVFNGGSGDDRLILGQSINGTITVSGNANDGYIISSGSGTDIKSFTLTNIETIESSGGAAKLIYTNSGSESNPIDFGFVSGQGYNIAGANFASFNEITLYDSLANRSESGSFAYSGGNVTFTDAVTLNVSSLILNDVIFSGGTSETKFVINGLKIGDNDTNKITFVGTTVQGSGAFTFSGSDSADDIIDLGKLAVPSTSLIANGGSGAGDILSFELTSDAFYTLVSGDGGVDKNFDKWGYSGNEAKNYIEGFETINITGSNTITLDASGSSTIIDRELAFIKSGTGNIDAIFGDVTVSGGSLTIDLSGSSSANTLTFGAVSLSGGSGINLIGGTGNDIFTCDTIQSTSVTANATDKEMVFFNGGKGNDVYNIMMAPSVQTNLVIEDYYQSGDVNKINLFVPGLESSLASGSRSQFYEKFSGAGFAYYKSGSDDSSIAAQTLRITSSGGHIVDFTTTVSGGATVIDISSMLSGGVGTVLPKTKSQIVLDGLTNYNIESGNYILNIVSDTIGASVSSNNLIATIDLAEILKIVSGGSSISADEGKFKCDSIDAGGYNVKFTTSDVTNG